MPTNLRPSRFRSPALLLSLLPSLTPGAVARAADPPEPIATVSAERGLAIAEAERKPCLVIALPEGSAESHRATLAERLRESSRAKLAEDFVVIEVILGAERAWPAAGPPSGTPEPWSSERARGWLEGRLGRLGDAPVVAFLDFSGVLLARFDGDPPGEAKLKKALRGSYAANEERRKVFAGAEKGLEQIGLALKRKLYADACRIDIELRKLDLPLESKPCLEREARHEELEQAWRARLEEASKLEEKEKLAEAVVEYDKIIREFPIPERQGEVRQRHGRLLRKIYGPNPPIPGGP
jgi:hypothetical protein